MPDKKAVVKIFKVAIKNKYLSVLVGIVFYSLSVTLWMALAEHENINRTKIINTEALKIAEVINIDLENRIKSLQRLINRWEVRGGTPKDEFINDVRAYIADDPGYQAISWVDKTYHVRWIIPLIGNEAAVNLNLGFEEHRRIALEKAKGNKLPTLTSPIDLVQGGKGFLVYYPIFINEQFEGFVTAVFRTQEWLNHIVHERLDSEGELYFSHSVVMDDKKIFATTDWESQKNSELEQSVEKDIYKHTFSSHTRPTDLFINQNFSFLPELVLCVGIVFSGLIAVIVYLAQKTKVAVNTIIASKCALENEIVMRKETQASLLEERKRLGYILDGTNAGTWEWNIETGSVTLNERWAEIIGYTLEELGEPSIATWCDFMNPSDLTVSEGLLDKHFTGKLDSYECESRMRHKDGHWVWVLARGKIFKWSDAGKPLLMSGTHSDITRQKEAEEKNRHLANHDALTNLPSLRLANDRIAMAIEMAKRQQTMAAVIFIDLDGFKRINDTHGHDVGNILLQTVAKRLLANLRKTDTVARIGGDEFLLIITDVQLRDDILSITKKTLQTISQPIPFKETELIVGASLGISLYPNDGDSAELLVKKADEAMYVSKKSGKNGYTFSSKE